MTSLFEQELLDMKREVRDMKTACQHGLGKTRFYSKEITIAAAAGTIYTFRATTAPGEPSPAFIMTFFSTSPSIRYVTGTDADETSRTFRFLAVAQTTQLTVRAVSTSNLTLEQV